MQALLAAGQQMLDTNASRPEHVTQVADKVKRLKDRWQDTRDRAIKRKVCYEGGEWSGGNWFACLGGFFCLFVCLFVRL